MRAVALCLLAGLLAGPATAQRNAYFHSQAGLCDVNDGVFEESSAVTLIADGMDSHFFECTWATLPAGWTKMGAGFLPARCMDSTSIWLSTFQLVPDGLGALNLFQGGADAARPFHESMFRDSEILTDGAVSYVRFTPCP